MPKLAAVPADSEADPCCCEGCEEVGENDLEADISGTFSSCGCNDTETAPLPVRVDTVVLTGTHTISFVSAGLWENAAVGTARVRYYGLADCSDDPFFDEICDVTMQVSCTGENEFFNSMFIPPSELPLPDTIRLFQGTIDELPGTANNDFNCGLPAPLPVEGGTVDLDLA